MQIVLCLRHPFTFGPYLPESRHLSKDSIALLKKTLIPHWADMRSKDCALLMTSADNFFWTFEQAVSYYQFAVVNYIGFKDKGMLLAGGCGDTNGRSQIDKTEHLQEAYEFGKHIYG